MHASVALQRGDILRSGRGCAESGAKAGRDFRGKDLGLGIGFLF